MFLGRKGDIMKRTFIVWSSTLSCTVLALLLAASVVAKPIDKPLLEAVANGNTVFAIDLYHRLGSDEGNLFFSPYSIYNALTMAAEGARGETAEEMGKVLCFPDRVRRVDKDAQRLPWRMSLIHKGLATLNGQLTNEDKDMKQTARQEIARLRDQLGAIRAKLKTLRRQDKRHAFKDASKKEKEIVARLNQALAEVDQYELRIANALWGEKTYPFQNSYIEKIAKYYKTGGIHQADFKNNFPTERERINNWVAEQTEDRIKDIIPMLPPAQARLLRLILTNAIYFKGEWAEPFKEANTKPREFLLPGGKKIQTPIMKAQKMEKGAYAAFNADGSFFKTPKKIRPDQETGLYPGKDGFAVIELPYKGEDLAMIVISPNSPDGLPAIEKKLNLDNLSAWMNKLQRREVHVFLPRFKLETKYEMKKNASAYGYDKGL